MENQYVIYFSGYHRLDNPKDGFFTSLVEELIVKWMLNNSIKTNEYRDMVYSNLYGHANIIWNNYHVDVKRINAETKNISINNKEFDKNIMIAVIVTKNNVDYLTMNHVSSLKNLGFNKKTYRVISGDDLLELAKKLGNCVVIPQNISSTYHSLLECYDKIPDIPTIQKGSSITEFQNAADTVL